MRVLNENARIKLADRYSLKRGRGVVQVCAAELSLIARASAPLFYHGSGGTHGARQHGAAIICAARCS